MHSSPPSIDAGLGIHSPHFPTKCRNLHHVWVTAQLHSQRQAELDHWPLTLCFDHSAQHTCIRKQHFRGWWEGEFGFAGIALSQNVFPFILVPPWLCTSASLTGKPCVFLNPKLFRVVSCTTFLFKLPSPGKCYDPTRFVSMHLLDTLISMHLLDTLISMHLLDTRVSTAGWAFLTSNAMACHQVVFKTSPQLDYTSLSNNVASFIWLITYTFRKKYK